MRVGRLGGCYEDVTRKLQGNFYDNLECICRITVLATVQLIHIGLVPSER